MEARINYMRKAIQITSDKCISAAKLPLFAKHYRTISEHNYKAFKCIHAQYIEQLTDVVKTELELVLEKEILDPMNELDYLEENCSAPKDFVAWRPSSDAAADCRRHLVATRHNERTNLQEQLSLLEADNRKLEDEVRERRLKARRTYKVLQTQGQLSESTGVLPITELEELNDETQLWPVYHTT